MMVHERPQGGLNRGWWRKRKKQKVEKSVGEDAHTESKWWSYNMQLQGPTVASYWPQQTLPNTRPRHLDPEVNRCECAVSSLDPRRLQGLQAVHGLSVEMNILPIGR